MGFYVAFSDRYDLVFLISIVLFPLSYKIGDLVFISWYEFINLDSLKTNTISSVSLFRSLMDDKIIKMDIYCRLLVNYVHLKKKVISRVKNDVFMFTSSIYFSKQKAELQEKKSE